MDWSYRKCIIEHLTGHRVGSWGKHHQWFLHVPAYMHAARTSTCCCACIDKISRLQLEVVFPLDTQYETSLSLSLLDPDVMEIKVSHQHSQNLRIREADTTTYQYWYLWRTCVWEKWYLTGTTGVSSHESCWYHHLVFDTEFMSDWGGLVEVMSTTTSSDHRSRWYHHIDLCEKTWRHKVLIIQSHQIEFITLSSRHTSFPVVASPKKVSKPINSHSTFSPFINQKEHTYRRTTRSNFPKKRENNAREPRQSSHISTRLI